MKRLKDISLKSETRGNAKRGKRRRLRAGAKCQDQVFKDKMWKSVWSEEVQQLEGGTTHSNRQQLQQSMHTARGWHAARQSWKIFAYQLDSVGKYLFLQLFRSLAAFNLMIWMMLAVIFPSRDEIKFDEEQFQKMSPASTRCRLLFHVQQLCHTVAC